MKLGLWKDKLVENVGGAYEPVVFLQVLKDEDKNKCPHCNKPIPTEIVSVVNSPNHKEYYQEIRLPKEQSTQHPLYKTDDDNYIPKEELLSRCRKYMKWCINPDCNAKFENIGYSHLSGDTRRSCDRCGVLWRACKACGRHDCQFTQILSHDEFHTGNDKE